MITFAVDEVVPVTEPLRTRPLREVFADAIAIGGDPARPIVEPNGVHPLLAAVGQAFAEHRPLVLSPDAVWLTIAQGVAQHVRLNAEQLRPLLVRHAGRKRLTVQHIGPMPDDPESWQHFVDLFSKLLAAEVTDAQIFECDFSTSTPVERTAGRVVLLDAYSPYFAQWLVCVCGIPSITLTGTVEDWRRIRSRVDHIEQLGLAQWCRSLRPITEQFARAAAGDVDVAFWQRIYNPADAYGGEVINGWAARLYPYLEVNGVIDWPNPLLDLEIGKPDRESADTQGLRSDSMPATMSTVIVNVNEADNVRVALRAGLVGVAQDDDGALRPVAGWHLQHAVIQIDDVVDRLVAEYEITPPEQYRFGPDGPADLIALRRRVGTVTLFDSGWRLRSFYDPLRASLDDFSTLRLDVVFDLTDGRHIAYAQRTRDSESGTVWWVVCRISEGRLLDDPAEVSVDGTSLAMLLDAAMDSGGEIDHLRTGTLADLTR